MRTERGRQLLLAVFGVTFVDFYLLKNKLLTFALTYFLFLLLLTRPILLFVMTMSLQNPNPDGTINIIQDTVV